MRLANSLVKVATLLGRSPAVTPEVDEAERIFRHIFRYLKVGTDKRYLPRLGQPNALVLQMAKVASTSIQAALRDRGINAFHSHGLSPAVHHAMLSQLLERDLTIPLAAGEFRRHILNVGMEMMVRWYQRHKQFRGWKLKVITLTRDPVTHYPSGLIQRIRMVKPAILAWQRYRPGPRPENAADDAQAVADFVAELASIAVEGRCSEGPPAYDRCVALARARWPEHPIVGDEMAAWLGPMTWFDREMTPMFDLDMLAAPGFRARGWGEQSSDWAEILIVRFEDLSSLVPEIGRFMGLADLTLPSKNISSAKRGAAAIKSAMQSALATETGRACARELRSTPYSRACGYDMLA